MTFLLPWRKKVIEQDQEGQPIFMIVGLGNPGREYRETRHNIGFITLDGFSARHAVKLSKVQNKAIIGIGKYNDSKIILVKPQTYMNLSGQSVSGLVRYYKVPFENLIVAHDDVDLPFGTIRIRPGGGSAGQKGINSIIQQLGTQDFPRLRMGVGRPPGQMQAADYVLQSFSKSDQELLNEFVDRAVDSLESFINDGLDAAMNRFNPAPQE